MVLVTINELIPLFNVITQTERLWHSQMTRNPEQTLATIRDMQPKLFQLSRRLRREAPSHKKIYINKMIQILQRMLRTLKNKVQREMSYDEVASSSPTEMYAYNNYSNNNNE